MSGALAARGADRESEKGRVEKTKVSRYWAGRAPEWAYEQEEAPAPLERVRTEVAAPVILRRGDDPRLRRLAGVSRADREEAAAEHRQIRAAEIVKRRAASEEPSSSQSSSDAEGDQEAAVGRRRHEKHGARRHGSEEEPSSDGEDVRKDQHRREAEPVQEEDEEELLKRRQAVREKLLQQQRLEEERQRQRQAQQVEEEEEEEEEESSEYETDSDDDLPGGGRLLKPVFVPKAARDTVAEREALDAEEAALAEREKKRAQERKGETKAIVAESLALEQAAAAAAAAAATLGADEIDTDDEDQAVEAYEEWKVRELRRIKRDREEREVRNAAAAEREKLRSMTEEERAAYEKVHPKEVRVKQKSRWRFLQKYWHKGAYFQEDADDRFGTAGTDNIFARDYSAPTGEDLFNKESMPKIMQVKNFGRSGRTKWTHLLSEDTTQIAAHDDLYSQAKDRIGKRRPDALSADPFARPTKFKR